MELRLTSAALVVVLATYAFLGMMGLTDRENPDPRDAGYNLLARGLLSGHLHIDKEAPPGLRALADPYDPAANKPFRVGVASRLHDISFYRGRLYLYFGVAPALLVFIPWHVLTGGWLPHWCAVALLCAAGLLVNLSLVRSVKGRVFPGSPPWMLAVLTLILGLGSYAPLLLSRADMWEVPIAFSYLAVSVALRCLWAAFCRPEGAAAWIAGASAALGAAFAARPNMLPNAAILALPFAFGATRRSPRAWAAAILPIGLCGAAVALYNALRFGNPFEFGQHYQLAGQYVARLKLFSAGYLPTNLRLYLLQPVQWSSVYPFANEPPDGMLPPDHGTVEHMSGVLLNAPILWAALAVPLFIRSRRPGPALALLSAGAAWVFASSLVVIALFFGGCSRYQSEFTPALALLAALGVMALESALSGAARGLARCAWVPLLAVSCAFPVLYGIDRCVVDHDFEGFACIARGDVRGAQREFDIAALLSPASPFARLESGAMLSASGRSAEALAVFESLVRDHPDYAMGQSDLGHELAVRGRLDEAVEHYEIAHRLSPDDAMIKAALDKALAERARRDRR
jgi:tetratricopeptide (TPR) repeat protein